MNNRILRTLLRPGLLIGALLISTIALAGGLRLTVERASPNIPSLADAVLVLRAEGCVNDEKAGVSATAEGIVDGKRVSKKLTLKELDRNVYAISQQWADEGTWVVAITGSYRGDTKTALVTVGAGDALSMRTAGSTPPDLDVTMVKGKPSARYIDAALKNAAKAASSVRVASGASR